MILELLAPPFLVAGTVLLALWRWREQRWPSALAIAAGYAVSHVRVAGLSSAAAETIVLPVAVAALVAIPWSLRALLSAGMAFLFVLSVAEPPAGAWPLAAAVAAGTFGVWSALERFRPIPLVLALVASASAFTILKLGYSAKLFEMTAGLAAATAAVGLAWFLDRKLRVDAGVFVVTHTALLWCAHLYADLPATALLLAAAPLIAGLRTRSAAAA